MYAKTKCGGSAHSRGKLKRIHARKQKAGLSPALQSDAELFLLEVRVAASQLSLFCKTVDNFRILILRQTAMRPHIRSQTQS